MFSLIRTSAQCYVSAVMKTEQAVPDITFSHKIFLNSQGDLSKQRLILHFLVKFS